VEIGELQSLVAVFATAAAAIAYAANLGLAVRNLKMRLKEIETQFDRQREREASWHTEMVERFAQIQNMLNEKLGELIVSVRLLEQKVDKLNGNGAAKDG